MKTTYHYCAMKQDTPGGAINYRDGTITVKGVVDLSTEDGWLEMRNGIAKGFDQKRKAESITILSFTVIQTGNDPESLAGQKTG